jgi:VanZ family protein
VIKLKHFRPLPGAVFILAVYWTLLFIATHLPSVPKVEAPRHTDKLVHFAGYAGLTFLAAVVYFRRRRWSLPAAVAILGAAMLYGVADELMQIPIPRRSADVLDWICDSLGAAAGLIVFRAVQRSRQAFSSLRSQARAKSPAWIRD